MTNQEVREGQVWTTTNERAVAYGLELTITRVNSRNVHFKFSRGFGWASKRGFLANFVLVREGVREDGIR